MKKSRLLLILSFMVLSGCAESSALIKADSTSLRTDVFEELPNGAIAPQGYSDLRITATLKTHNPDLYQFEKTSSHGTPDYKLLINIDGQAMLVRGSLERENREDMKLVDPETGDGIRYRFNKNLRLKAGTHRIVVALPADGVSVARKITLGERDVNSLAVEPMYRTQPGKRLPGPYNATSFKEGIRLLRLMLNGKEI